METAQGFLSSSDKLLEPQTTNTWLEIATESGVAGLLSLAVAVLLTLLAALSRTKAPARRHLVLAAGVAHLCVNLVFTQSFPRLDYWRLLFVAMRRALPDEEPQETVA